MVVLCQKKIYMAVHVRGGIDIIVLAPKFVSICYVITCPSWIIFAGANQYGPNYQPSIVLMTHSGVLGDFRLRQINPRIILFSHLMLCMWYVINLKLRVCKYLSRKIVSCLFFLVEIWVLTAVVSCL